MPKRTRSVVHIKHRTAGTSNELSFDVLEAKKNEADGGNASGKRWSRGFRAKKAERGTPFAGRGSSNAAYAGGAMPQLYTNDVAQAAKNIELARLPYENPAAEIVRRKRKRSRSRALSVALGAAVIAAIAFLMVTEVTRYLSDQEATLATLKTSLETVEEADQTIVAMDKLVAMPPNRQNESDARRVLESLPEANGLLDKAHEQATWASGSLFNGRDREAANRAVTAIEGRREMATQGQMMLTDAIAAKEAASSMDEAWALLLEADTFASQAGELVQDTTTDNVNASMEASHEAMARFEQAQDLVQKAQTRYPEADVTPYAKYIEKRMRGQEAALESDAAILLMDRGSAEEQSQNLYSYDLEAAEIAKGFPDDPTKPITDACNEKQAELGEKYDQARSQAASADAYLREYLGDTSK
jgi:hypothetical protein